MSPVWTPAQRPPDRTTVSCPSDDALVILKALREAHRKKRQYAFKTEGNTKPVGNYYATHYNKKFGPYNATSSEQSLGNSKAERSKNNVCIKIKEEPVEYPNQLEGSKNVREIITSTVGCQNHHIISDSSTSSHNYFVSTFEVPSFHNCRQETGDYAASGRIDSCVSKVGDLPDSGIINHSFAPIVDSALSVINSKHAHIKPITNSHFKPVCGTRKVNELYLPLDTNPTEDINSCLSKTECVLSSPPLSLSDDSSDLEQYNETSEFWVAESNDNMIDSTNRSSWSVQHSVQQERQSGLLCSNTRLAHNLKQYTKEVSTYDLASGVEPQDSRLLLGHSDQDRISLNKSLQKSMLDDSGKSEQKGACLGSYKPEKEYVMEHGPLEHESLEHGSLEHGPSVCKHAVMMNDTVETSASRSSVEAIQHSKNNNEFIRRGLEKPLLKKQKRAHLKRFQVPVKRAKKNDQMTITQAFGKKETSVFTASKELIDVSMIDDSMREQIAFKINAAGTVALTLVYADDATQLSGVTKKKSRSAKLHLDDVQAIAVIMVSMARKEEDVFVRLPLRCHAPNVNTWIRKLFEDLMINSSITKVGFGAKEMINALLECYSFNHRDVCSKWKVDDPMIAAWLLDADQCPHTLNELSHNLYKHQAQSNSQGRFNVCQDLLYVIEVMTNLKKKLNEANLLALYEKVEVKICPILAVMETLGISVDVKILLQYSNILQKKIKEIEKEALALMGYSFNINSNPQLRQVLFDELKLDEKYKKSIGKPLARTTVLQSKSTSESVLLKLKPYHKLPGLILEHRQLVKVNSTYIDGILEKVNNGTLHTTWDQTAASSGRITSANPNIQNIPKQVVVNGINDKPGIDESCAIKPRDAFKAGLGKTLIATDFQSIELRLLAHLSQDASLLAVFNSPGVTDVFITLTTYWLGIPKEKVTATDRDRTKRIVYSVFYGAGNERLSETLSVSTQQAKELRSSFLAKFPRVKQFTADCISKCRKCGFVETIFHRRRFLPNIKSSNFQDRSFAERQAVNFVVQGSAADLCKSAMIDVINELASKPDLKSQLLVQIHDELVLECPDEEVPVVTGILKSVMEGASRLCSSFTNLTVPILVSISVGKSWGDMVAYTDK